MIVVIFMIVAAFIFSTGGMAAHTVAKVGDAFFGVFFRYFGLVVTGVAGPLRQGRLVTGGTGVDAVLFLPVSHGEGMRAVIGRGAPGSGIMALRAGLAREHAQMVNRLGVADSALGGCAFVGIVLVALGARNTDMRAGEWEAAQVVVEGGVFPRRGVVANAAVGPKAALVSVVLQVTGFTGGGSNL